MTLPLAPAFEGTDEPTRRHYALAACVIGALLAVFFFPLLHRQATFSVVDNFQGYSYPWFDRSPDDRIYPQIDQADYVYPRQVFVDRALEVDRQVPLWNPMMFGGHPYFAQSGSRLAYPPMVLLSLLFDPTWTHDLYVVGHLFAAGMAVFALMRALRVGLAGSLLAGVAWAFGSYSLGWIQLEMFAAPAALLPLALLCVRRWYDRRSRSALLLGALALGFLFLGTTSELAFLSFLCVAAYAGCLALLRMVGGWRDLTIGGRLAVVAAPAALLLGAAAVAAVGIVPFLDLLRRSERAANTAAGRPIPGVTINSFRYAFVPPPVPGDSIWRAAAALMNGTVFVGTATALLAVVGLFQRRPGSGLGRSLAVGLFLFTIGSPVTWVALHAVPRLSALDGRGRTFFLWDLGLAVLGGLGLDAVLRWLRTRSRARAPGRAGRAWPALMGSVAVVCIATTAAQLLFHGRRVNPPFQERRAADLFPRTPAIDAVRSVLGASSGEARMLPVTNSAGTPVLAGAVSMAVGLPEAGGYETVIPATASKLWRVVAGEPEAWVQSNGLRGTFAPTFPGAKLRTDLLGRTGVAALLGPPDMALEPAWDSQGLVARGLRQTYAGADGTVYEVRDRSPRASVVTEAAWVGSSADALHRFVSPSFDAHRQVILEGRPPQRPEPATSSPGSAPEPRVEWHDDRPNSLRLGVTSPVPGWLVLLDSWDPGWKAMVNGRATEVLRANYNFRAVAVPAGSSSVAFSYRPAPVIAGAWISVLSTGSIAGILLLGWVLRRRRRRTPAAAAPAAQPGDRAAPDYSGS